MKATSQVIDSVNLKKITTDTTALVWSIEDETTNVLLDSLNSKVQLPIIETDSTLKDRAKNETANRLEEEFDTTLPKDSSDVIRKVKSMGNEEIQDQLDINIPGIPTDSAALKGEATSLAKQEFANQTGIEAPDIKLDSTTLDQLRDQGESKAEEALKNTDEFKSLDGSDSELGKLTDVKKEIELTREQLQQAKAKKEVKKKMASHAKDFISQHAGQLQEVQSQMSELKKKYSVVPNSNDLSTAKKRSSLKGESFWKRLILGGNLNVSKTNPINLDIAPVVGWRFNKLFEAGFTGTYRARLGAESSGATSFENDDVYGYSIFANHMAFKNFFGYLEGENMSKVTGTEENNKREWHQTLLVGIGRKFKIARFLEMQAIISYNFLHDNTDGVYPNPVVFKTGFRVLK